MWKETTEREYMHGKEWSMGERNWGWGAGSGCTEWQRTALVVKSCENHPSHLVKKEILWLV